MDPWPGQDHRGILWPYCVAAALVVRVLSPMVPGILLAHLWPIFEDALQLGSHISAGMEASGDSQCLLLFGKGSAETGQSTAHSWSSSSSSSFPAGTVLRTPTQQAMSTYGGEVPGGYKGRVDTGSTVQAESTERSLSQVLSGPLQDLGMHRWPQAGVAWLGKKRQCHPLSPSSSPSLCMSALAGLLV